MGRFKLIAFAKPSEENVAYWKRMVLEEFWLCEEVSLPFRKKVDLSFFKDILEEDLNHFKGIPPERLSIAGKSPQEVEEIRAFCLEVAGKLNESIRYISPDVMMTDEGSLDPRYGVFLRSFLKRNPNKVHMLSESFFRIKDIFSWFEPEMAQLVDFLSVDWCMRLDTDFSRNLYDWFRKNSPDRLRLILPETYLDKSVQLTHEQEVLFGYALGLACKQLGGGRSYITGDSLVKEGVFTSLGDVVCSVISEVPPKALDWLPDAFFETEFGQSVYEDYMARVPFPELKDLPGSLLQTEDGIRLITQKVSEDPGSLKYVPMKLLVADGKFTPLAKQLFTIVLKGDEQFSNTPNLESLSCFDQKMFEQCVTVVSYMDQIPSLDMSVVQQTVWFKAYNELLKPSFSWPKPNSLMVCRNLPGYVSLLREQLGSSVTLLTESSLQDAACRDRLVQGDEGGAPVVFCVHSHSGLNGLFDSKSRTVAYMPGQFITLHSSVKVVLAVKSKDEVSADVLSRVDRWHADPIQHYINSRPIAELPVGSLDQKQKSEVEDTFDNLGETRETLAFAEHYFQGPTQYFSGGSRDTPLVIRSPEDYALLLKMGGSLPDQIERQSTAWAYPPSEMMMSFESLSDPTLSEDFFPLFKGYSHVDSYCKSQIKGVYSQKERLAFFASKTIVLPVEKEVDLYQAVFKSSSGCWFFKHDGVDYPVDGVCFYDLRQASLDHFSTCSLELEDSVSSLLRDHYFDSGSLYTDTKPGHQFFEGLVSFLKSPDPLRIFEGPPATGKDAHIELALDLLKKMGQRVSYCSITASSDFPLLQQVQEAVSELPPVKGGGVYVVKISEVNLCDSGALLDVLFWAKVHNIPLKIIGTQNHVSLSSQSRFSTSPQISEACISISDYSNKDLYNILKTMALYYGVHQFDLIYVRQIFLHHRYLCWSREEALPTVRTLKKTLQLLASAKFNEPVWDESYAPYFIGYKCVYDPFPPLDEGVGLLSDSPEDFSLAPGFKPRLTNWRVEGHSSRDVLRFRVPFEGDPSKDPEIIEGDPEFFTPDPKAVWLSYKASPGENVRLHYFPDSDNKVIVFLKSESGQEISIGDIQNGIFTNQCAEPVIVAVCSQSPVRLLSDAVDSNLEGVLPDDAVFSDSYCLTNMEGSFDRSNLSEQEFALLKAICGSELKADLAYLFHSSYNHDYSLADFLRGIFMYFNAFEDTNYKNMSLADIDHLDKDHARLYWSFKNRVGVCRHVSKLLDIIFRGFGLEVERKINSSHSFVVVKGMGHKRHSVLVGRHGRYRLPSTGVGKPFLFIVDTSHFGLNSELGRLYEDAVKFFHTCDNVISLDDSAQADVFHEIEAFAANPHKRGLDAKSLEMIRKTKEVHVNRAKIRRFIQNSEWIRLNSKLRKELNRYLWDPVEYREALVFMEIVEFHLDILDKEVERREMVKECLSILKGSSSLSQFKRDLKSYLSNPITHRISDDMMLIVVGVIRGDGEPVNVSKVTNGGAAATTVRGAKTRVVESPCDFESIRDFSGDECPWSIDTVCQVIQKDSPLSYQKWVALVEQHAVPAIQKVVGRAIAFVLMERFPKGKKEVVSYRLKSELEGETNRVSYSFGEGDDQLCVIRTSVPCSSSDAVKSIFSTPGLARSYADENGAEGVYVITDQGPVLYASMGGGAGCQGLDLGLFPNCLRIVNRTLSAEGFLEIQSDQEALLELKEVTLVRG